jgi:GNAT superfamily N-acetyltransferase
METSIRLARSDDLPKLVSVERSAASLFHSAGLGWIADSATLERASLAAMCDNGTLWVAVDPADEPVGFLAAHEMDRQFYIAEISVARSHQRQGLGRALMVAAIASARADGYRRVTLTTYRDLPWNGPFYSRIGFAEIDASELGPEHTLRLQAENRSGPCPIAAMCNGDVFVNTSSQESENHAATSGTERRSGRCDYRWG